MVRERLLVMQWFTLSSTKGFPCCRCHPRRVALGHTSSPSLPTRWGQFRCLGQTQPWEPARLACQVFHILSCRSGVAMNLGGMAILLGRPPTANRRGQFRRLILRVSFSTVQTRLPPFIEMIMDFERPNRCSARLQPVVGDSCGLGVAGSLSFCR
jgi:hypothetical protein